MAWGRIDDGFDDHPKILALLDEEDQTGAGLAVGVWTLCFTWAHRNTRKRGKTPGLVPPGLPRRFLGLAGRQSVELLVKHELWDPHESGGWLIHDFGDYLPSDETREARSEAGKRGAAARWGVRSDAGVAGNTPGSDSNLPSGCHDDADNAVATDGSRTPARRDPTPTPTPKDTEPPAEFLFGADDSKPAKPKKRASSPATRIPDDFAVTPAMVAWAVENAPLVNGKWQTEKFIDHWTAATRNASKKNWEAAWRTWMRNAQEHAAERSAPVVQQDRRPGYAGGYPDRNGVARMDAQPRQSAGARKFTDAHRLADQLDQEQQFATGGAR